MFYVLTIVFGIAACGLTLSIVVGAFRQSVGQGLLCLFVPLYALFFAFTKWTFEKRAAVAGGSLFASAAFGICAAMAIKTAAADALAALSQPPSSPQSTSAPAATTGKLPIVATCTVSYGSRGLAVCKELHGASVPAMAAEKCKEEEGTFAAGATPCPTAGATGKCERASGETEVSYAGAVGDPKGSCEALGATWTPMAPAAVPAVATATARPSSAPKAARRK